MKLVIQKTEKYPIKVQRARRIRPLIDHMVATQFRHVDMWRRRDEVQSKNQKKDDLSDFKVVGVRLTDLLESLLPSVYRGRPEQRKYPVSISALGENMTRKLTARQQHNM